LGGFDWITTAEILVALCAFAIARRVADAFWTSLLKALLRRSQRLRLTVAASIASDKELGRWVAREEDDLEVAR